ncbi:MAG: ABC transporter ATP-binding protein [Anaerolineales bacterium]
MTTIIQTHNLTKIYGKGDIEVRALDGVDVQINENEFVAIMGPSGSGKSTLMNILGCLDRPTSGQYILAGEDVSGLDKAQLAHIRSKRLGFIFQAYNLLARTPAVDNVLLPLIYSRNGTHTDAEKRQIALDALASVGLADRAHHYPHELSGGQQQRVAIARALINDPVLILADEPTGNLDTRSSHDIMNLLHDLHERGRTIVMVTHENDIAAHASRVIHFRDGKIDADEQNGHRPQDQSLTIDDGEREIENNLSSSGSHYLFPQR